MSADDPNCGSSPDGQRIAKPIVSLLGVRECSLLGARGSPAIKEKVTSVGYDRPFLSLESFRRASTDMRTFQIVVASVALSACTSAKAVAIDPTNDVHCSVLSFYFHGAAVHDGAPDDQVRALKVLQDWYAAKMRSAEGGRYADPTVMESEIGPLLETVNADPQSKLEDLDACTDRAATDPSWNSFARSHKHQ